MNVLRTTEDAVNMLPVPTYLTASTAPVSLDTPVMVLPVQVRQLFRKGLTASLHHLHLYLFYFFSVFVINKFVQWA